MKKLVYITDPHCGWCYGNGNNISSVQAAFKDQFEFELLVGGMWLAPNAPSGGDRLSQYLQENGPRMAQTTGVTVGQPYYDLAKDGSYTYSSLEPCAAICLVKEIAPDMAFVFAKQVQQVLFVEGKKLDQLASYLEILQDLAIETDAFEKQWMGEENLAKTKAEFAKASALAKGFPTLVLQENETSQVLASGYFNLDAMQEYLKQLN